MLPSLLVLFLSISMSLNIDQELINELIKRQIAQEQFTAPPKGESATRQNRSELDPSLMTLLGSLADGASTYTFMRQGRDEDNALYHKMGVTHSPIATGAMVAATGPLLELGIKKVLGKRFPSLARALSSQHAAQRVAIAAENFSRNTGRKPESSGTSVDKAITHAIQGRR